MGRTSTTWAKGQSGNPQGRPRVIQHLREIAQDDLPEAYEITREIMRNGDKDSVRLAAARTIMQAAGVPLTSTSSDGASPLPPQTPPPSPSEPTPTAKLLQMVKQTPPGTSSGGGAS